MPDQEATRQRLREWRSRLVAGASFAHPEDALPIETPYDAVFSRIAAGKGATLKARQDAAAAFHERARAAHEREDLHLPHLAIGVLHGRAEAATPLLLVPVELRRDGDDAALTLLPGPGEPLLNPALSWLPDTPDLNLLPQVGDWEALRPSAWLDQLEAAWRQEDVRVERSAYLALLPVARWLLGQRLETDEGAMARHPLVRVLAGEQRPPRPPGAFRRGGARADEDDPCPSHRVWPTDAAQEGALKAARQGTALLAVGGLPGSGRTQVLANLLAASIAEGKTVLLVGRTPAGLAEVRRRLAGAALDGYCLTLRGAATNGAELLGELRAALAVRRETTPPPSPPTGEQPQEARARLAEYVKELHDRRWPLDRSVAEVLTELAGLPEGASLAWRQRHPELLTTEQLAECLALVERMAPLLDLAREAEAAPWERCLHPGSGEEDGREWRDLLGRVDAATRRLRRAATALAASHGLPAPGSPAEVERILDLDAWLLRDPPTPDHWLTELDVPAAREEAEWWQERMDAYLSEKARLQVSFDPALFELPEDALEDLEQAARRLELALGVNAGTILGVRAPLNAWISATRAALPEWRGHAERLAAAVGLAGLPIHIESALRLSGLARLLSRPERPPARWIDRRMCARVESALREANDVQQRLKKVRRAVLSIYAASVTEIEAERLIADFVARYGGRWRFLRPGYHATLRLLRRHRLDRQTPPNPLSDLRKIRFFRHCGAAMASLTERHRDLLGDYAPTLETSLAPARRALETARELLERAGAVDVEAITRSVRDSALGPEAVSWAADLERSLERNSWLMARCQGALPAGPVPGQSVALRQLPLDELEGWLDELAQALAGLDERLLRLRGLLISGDASAFGFEEALDALIRLAGLRSFERKLETDATHLRSVYGALFRGLDTDWPAVLDALDAVENARLVYGDENLPARGAVAHGGEADPVECRQLLSALESLFDELDGRFEQAHSRRRYPLDGSDAWAASEACLAKLMSWVDRREAWVELAHLRQEFEIAELAWLFQELRSRDVPPAQAVPAVRRAAFMAWWHAQRADSPALRDFDRRRLEVDIAEFRAAERRCRERARWEVIQAAEERRPSEDVLDGIGGDTTGLDLRALALQLRDTLRTLKPVVMACPLTAGLLPREMVFDRVVIHETAPIPAEEAVAALSRGRQAAVFGSWSDAGGEPGSLLAELTSAGALLCELPSDYRAPGEDGAPSAEAPTDPPRTVREQVARVVRGLGYEVIARAGSGPGSALLWVVRPDDRGRALLGIDASDAEPDTERRTLSDRYAILPELAERVGCPLYRVHTLEWIEDHAAAVAELGKALRQVEGGEAGEPVPYEVADLEAFALEPASLHEAGKRQVVVAALRHLIAIEGPVHRDRVAARIFAACGLRGNRRRQPALDKALRAALDEGGFEARGPFLHAPGGSPLRVRTPRADQPEGRRRLPELPPEEIALAAAMLLGPAGRLRRSELLTALTRLFGLGKTTRRAELEKTLREAGASRLAFKGEWVELRED